MDRKLIILLMALMGVLCAYAQEIEPLASKIVRTDSLDLLSSDSLAVFPFDTLALVPADTLAVDTVKKKDGPLDAPVFYQAKDSIIMTGKNWTYMFGESDVKYQNIQLESEIIELNMDSTLVYAKFALDSVGDEFGYPLFKDGNEQYESRMMRYNFKTGKGYITDVITQQGEGYVTAGRTKKMPDDVLNMVDGKYTTCDEHDDPHFYIQMTKAKVRPGKNIVTGPVYLVIEDVPLPLALPFCFFPFSSTYSSGIIMPTFGDESTRGYFLRDGGYYFALSDYMDLAVTGEIYTKGSWGLSARSNYRKRYRYSGSFNASYQITKYGDKIPDLMEGKMDDYQISKDFKLQWTHSQDPKANPYRTFSASVNFATSSYGRHNMNGFYTGESTENTKSSTVNITRRFPNNPFSISATMNVNQRTKDSTISMTMPDVSITMSRIYPFKRKNAIGKDRWYEKISMSYSGYFRNSIQTKEDQLLKSSLIKDWKNSMEHTIPVSATFTLFNYLNLSPSVNYKERWYTNKIEKRYDEQLNRVVPVDTTYGFYRIFDYSAAISASTTLYGFFKPLPFLGKKVEMIRHRFEPSVSLSATPDFGTSRYGYWENYSYMDSNGEMQMGRYSPFEHHGGIPGQSGKSGSVNFAVDNNLEMKIKSDRDSTGVRKLSLIDKLSMGMSYNFAADSFKWSNLNTSLRMKFSKSYTLNMSAIFDTYTYEVAPNGVDGRRVNKTRWQAGKGLGRLMSTGTTFSYTFNNDTFKRWLGGKDSDTGKKTADVTGDIDGQFDDYDDPDRLPEETAEHSGGRMRGEKKSEGEFDDNGYMITQIPWSLSFSYGMQLRYGKFDPSKLEYKYTVTHSLSFNGNIQPTKNWRLNFNATYDFDEKKISYMTMNITRNLHCFQMSANVIPVGRIKSYSFSIAVSSALLKDLKYNKSSNYRDGQKWL